MIVPLFPQLLAATNPLSVSVDLPYILYKWNHTFGGLSCLFFFPLSIMFPRFIHVVACISISFFFNGWVIFHHMTISLWVYFAKWNIQTEYQNWLPLEKLYWERESKRKVKWWLIERIFEKNYSCLKKTFMKVSVCGIRRKSFFVFLWNLHWNIDVFVALDLFFLTWPIAECNLKVWSGQKLKLLKPVPGELVTWIQQFGVRIWLPYGRWLKVWHLSRVSIDGDSAAVCIQPAWELRPALA